MGYTDGPPVGSPCADGKGGTLIRPYVTGSDALGKTYTYVMPDGSIGTDVEPPAGFDAATASPAELATYGLVQSATLTDPTDIAAWRKVLADYKPNLDDQTHWLCKSTLPAQTFSGGGKYSGYDGGKGPYQEVQGNVNAADDEGCSSDGEISQWVGMGGSPSAKGLVQAGTIDLASSGDEGFYEYLPDDTTPMTGGYFAGAGDNLYFRVLVQTGPQNINSLSQDGSAHQTITLGGSAYKDWTYDNSEGDFVEENTSDAGYANIKHAPFSWSNTLLTRGSTTDGLAGEAPGTLTGVNYFSNSTIEQPEGFTSTKTFKDDWVNC